ncbi:MAG: ferredoxin [Puniceicoccales bacterium]|jgi:ferredoxin|nr:ferredoxin [Puniceicoccales bacterium]
MASKDNRIKENVSGKFYVDDQCVDCDMCRNLAPDFFGMAKNGGSYVKKQPSTADEVDLCLEAMDGCPVDAVGDDGDDDEI